MDQTQYFKASLMTLKVQQRKAQGVAVEQEKNRILPKKASREQRATINGERDEFARQAKEVCQKITTLRNVLLENRSAYMRIGQHLKNAAHMTDEQRDLIDRESEKFVVYYTQHLAQMRADWKRVKRKPQQRQHIEAVLELLEAYLRKVQTIYVEQKKHRVQHELETYRLLKLAADKSRIPVRPAGAMRNKRRVKATSSDGSDRNDNSDDEFEGETDNGESSHSTATSETDISDGWHVEHETKSRRSHASVQKRNKSGVQDQRDDDLDNSSALNGNTTATAQSGGSLDAKTTHSSQRVALDEEIQKSQHEEEEAHTGLSPDDIQMYEQENVQLYHELQGLSEEVELIEKNVVDIAQLQDIFTEKVSLQQHNIERIANAVIGATENVKDANEQIKQAIQRNAGLRVWSLFFLLVMSFALLFLDWYYD